jgi:hypothetical protein
MNRATKTRLSRLEAAHDRRPENCESYEIIRIIMEPNGPGGCNGPPIAIGTYRRGIGFEPFTDGGRLPVRL